MSSIVRRIADTTEEQIKNAQTLARRSWLASLGLAGMAVDTTETTFKKFVRRGEKVADETRAEIKKLNQRLRKEQQKINEDVQDVEVTAERKVTDVLASFNVPTRRDLQVLDARIAQLNHQLRDLNTIETGAPIANYDALNVEEVNSVLPTLSSEDLAAVERYEAANQGRVTILREVERQLAQRLTENGEVVAPFAHYEELRAEEVIERLDGLTLSELRHVKIFESTHAKRVTVQREVERRIEASWIVKA